jgi:hypothetical protein
VGVVVWVVGFCVLLILKTSFLFLKKLLFFFADFCKGAKGEFEAV